MPYFSLKESLIMPKEATVVVDLSEKLEVWAYYKWFVFFEVLYYPHVTFCLSNCIEWIGLLLKIAKDWKVRQHVQQVIREAAVTRLKIILLEDHSRLYLQNSEYPWSRSGCHRPALSDSFLSSGFVLSLIILLFIHLCGWDWTCAKNWWNLEFAQRIEPLI